jgi:predicted metalloprotease with PDZ domain
MTQRAGRIAGAILLLLAARAASAQEETLSFQVDVTRPETRRVRVQLELRADGPFQVSLPAWAPGAYRIVNYAQHVKDLGARDAGGRALAVEAADAQTWNIPASPGRVSLSYEVVADPLRFDRDHCFLAGPDTFLYVVGGKERPCSVRFTLPEDWKVGTGLDRLPGDAYGAADYDTFIDCPIELGRFQLAFFEEDGARYELVVHSRGPVNLAALTEMCRKIVKEQNRLFGGPPFKRYVFLYHFRDGSGGRGLEHLNSTDIVMPYPAVRLDPLINASITSHEYFHLWNVKRIRPAVLGPFDYTRPVRTKALWFCEGVTSYYGDRSLVRAGLWTEAQYFAHLAGQIETLQNNPDRKVTSVEKASWDVWDRTDWPRVDYYNKGELLGLLIDLRIRTSTSGARSLDDVMRLLLSRWVTGPAARGKGPIGVGFPEDEIRHAVEEVAGGDWGPFFRDHVGSTRELPYEEILGAAGLAPKIEVGQHPDLGLILRGTQVAHIAPGSAAERAGFKAGDRLAFLEDEPVVRATLVKQVGKLAPGTSARIRVLRDRDIVPLQIPVGRRELTTCRLERADSLSPLQDRLLRSWLSSVRDY